VPSEGGAHFFCSMTSFTLSTESQKSAERTTFLSKAYRLFVPRQLSDFATLIFNYATQSRVSARAI
jgi:hypothetical protein